MGWDGGSRGAPSQDPFGVGPMPAISDWMTAGNPQDGTEEIDLCGLEARNQRQEAVREQDDAIFQDEHDVPNPMDADEESPHHHDKRRGEETEKKKRREGKQEQELLTPGTILHSTFGMTSAVGIYLCRLKMI